MNKHNIDDARTNSVYLKWMDGKGKGIMLMLDFAFGKLSPMRMGMVNDELFYLLLILIYLFS